MDQFAAVDKTVWLHAEDCDLSDFRAEVERDVTSKSVPLADDIQSKIPIYHSAKLRDALGDQRQILSLIHI